MKALTVLMMSVRPKCSMDAPVAAPGVEAQASKHQAERRSTGGETLRTRPTASLPTATRRACKRAVSFLLGDLMLATSLTADVHAPAAAALPWAWPDAWQEAWPDACPWQEAWQEAWQDACSGAVRSTQALITASMHGHDVCWPCLSVYLSVCL